MAEEKVSGVTEDAMDVVKRSARAVRARWLIGCAMIVAPIGGCRPVHHYGYQSAPSDECTEPDACADAHGLEGVCAGVSPFGFYGPSLVVQASSLDDVECPDFAPLEGFWGSTATGDWVRECLITREPTCEQGGMVCVPQPPAGFDVCLYRGEPSSCPDDYPHKKAVMEAGHSVTLCCLNACEAG
jgi:hypothetical protein